MPKIDLTGRINGDFIVLSEYETLYDSSGKKKARWLCQCQACKEKEVVLGESIRKNYHRFCSYCLSTTGDSCQWVKDKVEDINSVIVKHGYKPMTVKQFINVGKFLKGNLAAEDESTLPDFIDQLV